MKRDDKTQAVPREREIFLAASEIDDRDERKGYLDRACGGDESLRRAVEELIENNKDDDFLQKAVSPAATTEVAGTISGEIGMLGEKVGDHLGPYKLLQKIGEGGVGIVYLAEQEEPVRRRVAIKVLKPGIETKSVIARFESESQALAMM
ncbi:MAG TPA: serine/threonine protein kinase, partial [Verrucomicrobiales bacterium]|nr:serine/threonine protein kinase [Verrucomicrobiales bacterium]